MSQRRLLGIGIWAVIVATGQAATIYVNGSTGNDAWTGLCEGWDGGTCGPKLTIQAGIDAAVNGDTVTIADGTYTGPGNKDLDFVGKAITVRSANGPGNCIIDCEGNGRGCYFHSGEPAEAVLQGLTITGGDALFGGAIYCTGQSAPTVDGCVITANTAYAGAGVYVSEALPSITHCTISENAAYWDGGGVYIDDGAWPNAIVSNCSITGNTARWHGGGLCIGGTSAGALVSDCVISANRAEGAGDESCGGGVYQGGYFWSGSGFGLVRCTITGNFAESVGGGVGGGQGGSSSAWQSRILGNMARKGGRLGSLSQYACSYSLVDCLIASNFALERGGGIYWQNLGPNMPYRGVYMNNTTVSGNTATVEASGICFRKYGQDDQLYVQNSIIWGNVGTEYEWDVIGPHEVAYSDIHYGPGGEGNIDADPRFADPSGPDGDPLTWEDNDYRLTAWSPCRNAGSNALIPADSLDLDGDGDTSEPIPYDLVGRPRVCDQIVDMGAYESHAGDLNCDAVVDFDDINPFVLALIDPIAYQAVYPNCELLDADCNYDGLVDFDDINSFVYLLQGS